MMPTRTLPLPPRYAGVELVARGGMADVYRAEDIALARLVAVKVLGDRYAGDEEIRKRFTREARTAAKLSGAPNVVTIYDVGEAAGRPTIVMEYLPGGTLADRLRDGPVPPAQALAWLEQAGRALDAAHALGVVHRDVKPANLMLAADGEVRVTDFGIARAAGNDSLTSAGTILGTSGYMSPEQAIGGRASAASDRYGLAVVAFELLTGRRPFVAESQTAEAMAHATSPPPVAHRINGSLPPGVDDALRRGLAKDPAERPASCGELVAALRAVFHDVAGTTGRIPAPPRPASAPVPVVRQHDRRRAGLLALPLLVVAGVGVAAVLGRGGGEVASRTLVRTETVAGAPQVTTVTVERVTTEARPAGSESASGTDGTSGAALNDEGYRRLQAGDVAGALPLLEQAVAALQGSGSLAEAYASYNLALARFASGRCDGVQELLDRSQQVQGERAEIRRLQKQAGKACDD